MEKLLFSTLLILGLSVIGFCQLEEKMKKEGVVAGAIFKDGKEINGYIKKTGTAYTNDKWFPAPWEFQGDIRFITEKDFAAKEEFKKKDFEKYGAKDCDGYRYDTLIFESVKYIDLSDVSANMMSSKLFMRKVVDNKVSLFYYYSSPPSVVSGSDGFEPYYIECAEEKLIYRVGEKGKLKPIGNLNITKELSDCPMVVEKHEKGEYKLVGNEEASGANKLMHSAFMRDEVRIMAVEDYNANRKLII